MTDPMIYTELATVLVLTLALWTSIRLLDLNTRPQIECYVRTRRDSPNVFDLVILSWK